MTVVWNSSWMVYRIKIVVYYPLYDHLHYSEEKKMKLLLSNIRYPVTYTCIEASLTGVDWETSFALLSFFFLGGWYTRKLRSLDWALLFNITGLKGFVDAINDLFIESHVSFWNIMSVIDSLIIIIFIKNRRMNEASCYR